MSNSKVVSRSDRRITTYEQYVNSLDFSEGYAQVYKSLSYVKGGLMITSYNYSHFLKYQDELIKNGYHLVTSNTSNNFFRDDITTFIYKPENAIDAKIKNFKLNHIHKLYIVLFIILIISSFIFVCTL